MCGTCDLVKNACNKHLNTAVIFHQVQFQLQTKSLAYGDTIV